MSDIVSVTELSFSYRNWESRGTDAVGVPVFSHIDLHLEPGSRTLVLAPPDSGKTTLARILAGLVPKYMDGVLSGSIVVDGHDLSTTEPWELVRSCGYVSQNPSEEFIASSCEDEIAFPLESLGLPRYEIIRHVRASLEKWGLVPMREANAQELSGGERKRLLLAVQDAVCPRLWILDESFDDLDISWRERLLERIGDRGITTLAFGSRYLEQFHGTFDRYALLNGGTLTFGDETDIALEFERLCETPYAGDDVAPSADGFHEPHLDGVRARPFAPLVPLASDTTREIISEAMPKQAGHSFATDAVWDATSEGFLEVMSKQEKHSLATDAVWDAIEVLPKQAKHSLACRDVSVTNRRRSSIQEVPFSLSVPAFQLESGSIMSLCGPNGSGKSTFSRLLCGLDEADAGTFLLDDGPATQTMLNRSVGYLFQNPDYQIFLPTVREELAWSLKRAKLSQQEISGRVEECADLFRLDVRATPTTMSFGLRKSLQAAVYYLLDRPFYILDELDSALTYATAFELIGLLRRNGAGILMITHDQQFADALAERSCHIVDGTLLQDEDVSPVSSEPNRRTGSFLGSSRGGAAEDGKGGRL